MYVHVCLFGVKSPQRPEEEVRGPGAGVAGICEPPDMVLENELGSPRRAVHAPNYRVIFPGPISHYLLGYSTPRKEMLVGAWWEIPNSRGL